MKNLLFWGGLFLATFWDEMLLAATQPKKTKRQQQFLQAGETAQYFIGEIEPNIISVLKKIFPLKVYEPDTGSKYDNLIYPSETLYQFKGGPEKKGFNIIMNKRFNDNEIHFPSIYGADSYKNYYGNIKVEVERSFDDEQTYMILWFYYIKKFSKTKLDKIPNFKSLEELVKNYENLELAFLILSGVPNIKNILT